MVEALEERLNPDLIKIKLGGRFADVSTIGEAISKLPIGIIKIGGEIPSSKNYKVSTDRGTILLGVYRKSGDELSGLTTFNIPEGATKITGVPNLRCVEFTYNKHRYRLYEVKER
jgi:hypothetical protein